MFRILNSYLQLFWGGGYQWIGRAEHMFNLLNTLPGKRNYSPLVCKFLDNMTAFFHARMAAARRCSYLLEKLGFRRSFTTAIVLPMALLILAVLIHIRKGM